MGEEDWEGDEDSADDEVSNCSNENAMASHYLRSSRFNSFEDYGGHTAHEQEHHKWK